MGWVYGFHSLNPAVIRELLDLSADEIRRLLIQRGVSPGQVGIESWDEDDLNENEALTILASTQEWDVDKSLENIQALSSQDPGLAPVAAALREMESFRASQVPDRFHPRETGSWVSRCQRPSRQRLARRLPSWHPRAETGSGNRSRRYSSGSSAMA